MGFNRDYDALRAQAMDSGNDEAVTVNTRALIDKVLARYPGEWTTLRELIQNAADASASKVTIKIETAPSAKVPVPQGDNASVRLKHVLSHHTVNRWIVENDGEIFGPQDWARLKKIAEGNPDETKIGAFGVGFYSVFDASEEPFVLSGSEALEFYWKSDTLYTKRLQLGPDRLTSTTFVLPMRDKTSSVPQLLSLCKFLTSSLTFVGLATVELWLDEWKVFHVKKVAAPSSNVDIPRGIGKTSENGLMRISAMTREAIQIEAHWIKAIEWKPTRRVDPRVDLVNEPSGKSLRSFFSKLASGSTGQAAEKAAREEKVKQKEIAEDLMGESRATAFLHVIKADVNTMANRAFSAELERATKKPPPKTTCVSLLTMSYNEQEASDIRNNPAIASLFDLVIPSLGRVFIGFSTKQTTGLSAHVSAPSIIPTVERESIDLNSHSIKLWNSEILTVAGIVARITWKSEMSEIRLKLSKDIQAIKGAVAPETIAGVLPEAQFLHNNFSWKASTPLPAVAKLIEDSFWTSDREPLEILSSRGVVPAANARIAREELTFAKELPVIPELLTKTRLVEFLVEVGVIKEVLISDIIGILERKPLDLNQLQCLLVWLTRKSRTNAIDKKTIQSILEVTVANHEENGHSKVLVLSQIKTFLNPDRIPPDMPIPSSTMPFSYTKSLSKHDTDSLGWDTLQIVSWLRWLLENTGGQKELPASQDITSHPTFALSVLRVLSKQWDGLSASSKTTVVQLLADQTVMPTKVSMKRPAEAYFPSVRLFEDLPVVLTTQSVKEKVLAALGVRKTIEIGLVLERLMSASSSGDGKETTTQWSHVDLIKYLTTVWVDVPTKDRQRLYDTSICKAENTSQRYRIAELYEPNDALRRIGLPVIQWPSIYNSASKEGKLLKSLGLRESPLYADIIKIISDAGKTSNTALRDQALRYLVENHQSNGYESADPSDVAMPYLPLDHNDTRLATPKDCFTNERVTVLGFDLLRRDLHRHASKLGVSSDPPPEMCISHLLRGPPQSKRAAREVFGYLAGRIAMFSDQQINTLSQASIVPVLVRSSSSKASEIKSENTLGRDGDSVKIRHLPPRMCFLGDGGDYGEVFDFVDFGSEANTFLLRCGSKNEPTTPEIAYILTQQPARFFGVLGMSKYFETLIRISNAWKTIKSDKRLVDGMRKAPFLLASRETAAKELSSDIQNDRDEDSQSRKTWQLAQASQIVVVDDVINYQIFKSNLLAAPQEEPLEDLYLRLGASGLSSLVVEQHNIGKLRSDQTTALRLQDLIKERSRLYLHDYLPDAIRHDASWVRKHLTVQSVQSIALWKTLRGLDITHSESKTATRCQGRNQAWVLYVTNDYDIWQVSQVLVDLLLNRPKPKEAIVLQMVLRSDLLNLRAMGYNVERILRQKEEARIAHDIMLQRQAEQEERELREREAESRLQKPDEAEADIMPGMFPKNTESKEQSQEPRDSGGLLAGFGRRFGLELGANSRSASKDVRDPDIQNGIQQQDIPPPSSSGNAVNVPRAPGINPPGGSMSPHELSSM